MTSDGKYATIEAVRPIHYETPQTTYNFEVEGFHTYYVGNGVLVHNMNGADCGSKYITNKEAEVQANKLGYKKVKKVTSHGRAVFKNPKAKQSLKYITSDYTSHNGGYWKAADTIENLFDKATRSGTYDINLTRRIGD